MQVMFYTPHKPGHELVTKALKWSVLHDRNDRIGTTHLNTKRTFNLKRR